jgi:hypothetical protein
MGEKQGGGEMNRFVLSMVACLAVLGAASPAPAQDNNPCAADIERFCSNIQPGMGRIADCLKQNEDQLSPECKQQHLSEVADALRQTQEACGDDSVQYCGKYLQPPGEGLLNCLKLNATSLSPQCREKLFETLNLMQY